MVTLADRLFDNPCAGEILRKGDQVPLANGNLSFVCLDRRFSLQEVADLLLIVVPVERGGLFGPDRPTRNLEFLQPLLIRPFYADS